MEKKRVNSADKKYISVRKSSYKLHNVHVNSHMEIDSWEWIQNKFVQKENWKKGE